MSTISWNYQGLRNCPTALALKRAFFEEAPTFVFLMETQLSSDNMNRLKNVLGCSQGIAVSSDNMNRFSLAVEARVKGCG